MELFIFALIFLWILHKETKDDKKHIGWKKGDKTKWWWV
jgi:hypothetical protein